MKSSSRRRSLGLSLIEALVALAVMSIGMLGVVGMQSTLRFNADVSRQRAEGMRLAQEQVERLQSYSGFTAVAGDGLLQFEEIGDDTADVVYDNTTYTVTTSVTASGADEPPARDVLVEVTWDDRRGVEQLAVLSSRIAYVPAELAALPARRPDRGAIGQPGSVNPAIPRPSLPVEGSPGLSRFSPPGSGISWIFNNDTGLIVSTCPTTTAALDLCTPGDRHLVAGTIAFELGTASAPTAADAENPDGSVLDVSGLTVGVNVKYTLPTPASTLSCFTQLSLDGRRLSYFCAVPLDSSRVWTGIVDPQLTIGGVSVRADDVYPPSPRPAVSTELPTDKLASRFRVCRYTPLSENRFTPVSLTTAGYVLHNGPHPWRYVRAARPYTDRNFLIIRAGTDPGDDSGVRFDCPAEDETTSIRSNTFHHPKAP